MYQEILQESSQSNKGTEKTYFTHDEVATTATWK